MAKPETKTENTERVKLLIPRGDQRGDPNFFISVNGVNYLIPRGKTVEVPPAVAEEYQRSERAKEAFFAKSDELLERAKQR